jgi:hypothetical protein
MKFNHPAGIAAANRTSTNGAAALSNWGEHIWDHICFLSAKGEEFTNREVVSYLVNKHKLAVMTATNYWRAFRAYALVATEEFSGPASRIERAGPRSWRLGDNPEL